MLYSLLEQMNMDYLINNECYYYTGACNKVIERVSVGTYGDPRGKERASLVVLYD